MTIVVHRNTGAFAVVRRIRVQLDGTTVGRVGHGQALTVTGSGVQQRLSVSIDWVGSNELTVVDPGPDAAVDVELTRLGATDSIIRTWLAPKSVLRLAPSGQPVPPPPPVQLTWRKVARLWLVVTAAAAVWTVLVNLGNDGLDDLSVVGVLAGVSLGVALIVAAVAVALRGAAGQPPSDDGRPRP